MTSIDSTLAKFVLNDFRKILNYMEGAEVEYEGR